jgi:uncharacterized protein YkwD
VGLPKKVNKLLLLAHKRLSKNKYKVFLFGSIVFSWCLISFSLYNKYILKTKERSVLGASISKIQQSATRTLVSPVVEITKTDEAPTIALTISPTITTKAIVPTPTPTEKEQARNPSQYTAEKIDDVTWKVHNIQNDDKMASASDIVNAINSYRGSHGLSNLSVDGYLSTYAQERASLFARNGSLDSHAGFNGFMDNGGFDKAGFNSLGENSAFLSGPMNGDKIVRDLFGADASHDNNQLDNWTHVGVGVDGNAVNVNFGKGKK